jgi:hypothetical protein
MIARRQMARLDRNRAAVGTACVLAQQHEHLLAQYSQINLANEIAQGVDTNQ